MHATPSVLPNLVPSLLASRVQRAMELRIDVDPSLTSPSGALAPIYERLNTPGDRLHGIPSISLGEPELQIRFREADGEFYVYVEDVRRGCLAGYTVFNRLVELGSLADRYVRAPHSQYEPGYRRRGLASGIYRWALDSGLCLMTGARQSHAAHALWRSLAHHYVSGFVDLRHKRLTYLGREVSASTLAQLHTRMFLLGGGWTQRQFKDAVRMS
ncbi:hypothetical protein H6CHR_02053 [Variovorax sp. PBL-H6]|uniref:N-acetyltransferase n=1 Tax=Variovorax sp. PBL-H6 TaxID=434009 RepID=UPI001317348E|nr:N-acetyltransferase [Variovorax sp. PBL-H6]VTU23745.1 hypothetical protein H6CHR_02053 [Variovorax sp. PBL-H6]